MPAARTDRPTSTNNPTRSSVHVTCLRCAIFSSLPFDLATDYRQSHEKPLQIFIFRIHKFFLAALEINSAIPQNQKTRRRHPGFAWRVSIGHRSHNPFGCGVEAKVRESETVLKPLRREERRDAEYVSQAQNERDDCLRSDWIQPGCRRIVEHDGRLVNQRSRDGHAAP